MSYPSHRFSQPLIIGDLTLAERIELVEQIWDSIAAEQASLRVVPAQQAELDRRLEAYRENPTAGASWEEVRARLRAQN
jgi:putative addiction module component (TIGR02574 family)